jgi:hypothetical protein
MDRSPRTRIHRNPPRRINRSNRSYSRGIGCGGVIAILVLLFIVGAIGFEIFAVTHKTNVTFTVQDKTIKIDCNHDSNGGRCSSKYLIFTDHGVYQDTDSIFYLKFNSSDVYGKLKRNHTYNCKVYGFRIPIISHYKNLVSCKEVTDA